jgi:cytochrome c oxidase assembly factor CtaG
VLSAIVAHAGALTGWHDLWSAWNLDAAVLGGLAATAWLYQRGSFPGHPEQSRRAPWLWAGLLAVAVALLSPLDALAGQLASAHMIQHMLLVVVAAPLLALGAPLATLVRGCPVVVRRRIVALRRRMAPGATWLVPVTGAAAWLLHTGSVWFWHASVPYQAALEHDLVHAAEHASFLFTGVVFWTVVVRTARSRRAAAGLGALLVFTMAMQSVLLALLLTFASTPWYDGYNQTTGTWGLDPLADQQLAGAIMWVPGGLVYVAAGIALVGHWIRGTERRLGRTLSDWDYDIAAP